MDRIGIVYHPFNKDARSLAKKLAGFLCSSGVRSWASSAWKGDEVRKNVDGSDLVVTIGGDGTILRAAQAVAPRQVPITGINLGRFGFLTELTIDEAIDKMPALLAGRGWLDERAMLEAEVITTQAGREGTQRFFTLNDIVVARGEIARIIDVEASIDGELLTTYKADGVIVATATGSTGYALSAGGPILNPNADEFLMVPILPYLSLRPPLVLSPKTAVELKVGNLHKAVLSIDGHISLPLEGGTSIKIKLSSVKTCFLRVRPRDSFYSTLERKLKG
ncbi:MAG TPA: NAD(+)/NADH kinase [Dehalococcoidia bacterium]|nr:NAD(+)/NADH kinase [Dehalococcoidia bacterium]